VVYFKENKRSGILLNGPYAVVQKGSLFKDGVSYEESEGEGIFFRELCVSG
jgi:hypothetical protein